MTKQDRSVDRRRFVQLATLGAVPVASALTSGSVACDAAETSPTSKADATDSPNMLRIGTIQSRANPHTRGLETNPFSDRFAPNDLKKSVDGSLKWYEELIGRSAAQGCKLVVLTEDITRLSNVMTYLDDRSLFVDTVTWQTPRVAERLGNAARKHAMYVVASYFALDQGTIYNVADLFGPAGDLVGRYRKVHLPQYELWQVTAGDQFPAFETDIGWIGMLICYDQMWPESASCCAMNGAQLICQPSAASLADYHMKARAVDNQVHLVSSTSRNSMIVSPRSDVLADAERQNPGVVWADVDLENATKPRDDFYWEHLYSGIKDHKERVLKFRRSDTYGVLCEPDPPLAAQYPEGGVANTPEEIDRVYQIHKKMRTASAAGNSIPYHWTS